MQVLRVVERAGSVETGPAVLPHREAREKGPTDVVPATSFWLARLGDGVDLALHPLGALLLVVLSGSVTFSSRGGSRERLATGDLLSCDVASPGAVEVSWDGDAWLLLISTPGWTAEPGELVVPRLGEPRPGRPGLTWVHDDGGRSRTQPLVWPHPLTAGVPAVDSWPSSRGAFVTRRDYGDDGFAAGVWHNGPRRQLAVTLNGRAQLQTSDGTTCAPVAGDVVLIDDTTGPGHVTRGRGERWMLFVTTGPGELDLVAER